MESQNNIYTVEHLVIKSEPVDNDDEVTPLREERVCSPEPAFANNCGSGWNTDDEGNFESQPNDNLLEVFKEETRDDLDLDFLDDLSLPDLTGLENVENRTLPSEHSSIHKVIQEDVIHEDIIQEDVIQEDVIQEDVIQEDVIQEDVIQEDVVQEDVIQEDVIQKDVTQEDVIQEDVIQEDVIQEDVTQEDVIQETIAAESVTSSTSGNGLHRDLNYNVRAQSYKRELHFRIRIRGLHSFTSSDWISFELSKLGHTISRVKRFVNEFQVDLLPNNNNRNILNLTKLDHYNVNIIMIPYQCYRCTLFDHRVEDCVLQGYICFKCAESHYFANCPNSRVKPWKCSNCGANHKANFYGCPVYKDAVKKQLMNRFIEHANQDLHLKPEQDNNKANEESGSPSVKRRRMDESSILTANTEPTQKSLYKLPNIIIANVKDAQSLIQKIIGALGHGSFGIKTYANVIHFQCCTWEKHITLIKTLRDLKYKFRIQKTFRMMIKGLHPYTSPDWIAGKLNKLGHAVQHIENIIDQTTNHPTSNFNVDFLQNINSSIVEIMKITMLGTYIVTIEQPYFGNQWNIFSNVPFAHPTPPPIMAIQPFGC